jgi:hypothetical protein
MAADAQKALEEIRKIYFATAPATIGRDFDRAIDILKALPTDEDREKAAVYMEGLAEMRKEWKGRQRPPR